MQDKFEFKDIYEYREYLDESPNKEWLQQRDLGGGKTHLFLPLFILEANADICFREWNVVNEEFSQFKDGVFCTVKINALPDYPSADYITFTGSAGVMFKKNKNSIEFDPANARERAIGKALATLGNIFGRSLNRTYKINGQTQRVSRGFTFKTYKKDEETK